MTLEEYENEMARTARNGLTQEQELLNAALGLGESGEVQNLIKKVIFHGHTLDDGMKAKIVDELGDQLFYIAWMARIVGRTLDDVALGNVTKLRKRYPAGFSTEASINRVE